MLIPLKSPAPKTSPAHPVWAWFFHFIHPPYHRVFFFFHPFLGSFLFYSQATESMWKLIESINDVTCLYYIIQIPNHICIEFQRIPFHKRNQRQQQQQKTHTIKSNSIIRIFGRIIIIEQALIIDILPTKRSTPMSRRMSMSVNKSVHPLFKNHPS